MAPVFAALILARVSAENVLRALASARNDRSAGEHLPLRLALIFSRASAV